MKSIALILSTILLIGVIAWKGYQAPKSYTVSLTKDQWLSIMASLDSCNKIVQESDIPVRKANFILQSYSVLYQTVASQVGAQIQADEKAAADTTKPSAKKPK